MLNTPKTKKDKAKAIELLKKAREKKKSSKKNTQEKRDPRGRKSKYSEEMQDRAEHFIEKGYKEINKEALFPNAAGMALYLDVNKDTLYEWAKRHPTFSDTLKKMNEKQGNALIFNGLSGKYNSVITKLALHNHGYKDKGDVTSNEEKIDMGVTFLPKR